ncbi:hypothetical protein Hdeb2414_s0010g00355001 [Helianthus debilis subsp. tardiflorus]
MKRTLHKIHCFSPLATDTDLRCLVFCDVDTSRQPSIKSPPPFIRHPPYPNTTFTSPVSHPHQAPAVATTHTIHLRLRSPTTILLLHPEPQSPYKDVFPVAVSGGGMDASITGFEEGLSHTWSA